MKKRIITLMLSAFIFTTNPLFAMEPEDTEEQVMSLCSRVLTPEDLLRFEGFGNLTLFSDEILVNTLKNSPIPTLGALSCTSKMMHSFCEDTQIWRGVAKNLLPALFPHELSSMNTNDAKKIIQKYHHFFKLEDKNYQISMDMFKFFIRNPIPNTFGKKFEFTIGDQDFLMEDNGLCPFFANFLFWVRENPEEDPSYWERLCMQLDTKPFFQYPQMDLIENNVCIFFAAQQDQGCFQSNFALLPFTPSCKIFDKWFKENDHTDQLVYRNHNLLNAAVEELRIEEPIYEAGFKITKK